MAEVRWTLQADKDLEEIAFYIAFQDRRPATAERVVDEIQRAAELYAAQPEMGTAAPELGDDLRTFPHKRWVVFYEPVSDGILIRTVIDGARDYPNWSVNDV